MHDPRAALSTIGQYDRLFAHGALESEAASIRVEAVIQLDDRRTALVLLDGMRAFPDPLGMDLLLVRAELRASHERWRDALLDFTQVLDSQGPSMANRASERALYGRAVCLGRLGQDARARVDLVAYQRRFPTGRFASEVIRLLDEPGRQKRRNVLDGRDTKQAEENK
jgi:hypothetical protein